MIPHIVFMFMSLSRHFILVVSVFFTCLLPLHVRPGDMLDLLKWRAHPERINDSLSKLKDIDGSEIVKVGPLLR